MLTHSHFLSCQSICHNRKCQNIPRFHIICIRILCRYNVLCELVCVKSGFISIIIDLFIFICSCYDLFIIWFWFDCMHCESYIEFILFYRDVKYKIYHASEMIHIGNIMQTLELNALNTIVCEMWIIEFLPAFFSHNFVSIVSIPISIHIHISIISSATTLHSFHSHLPTHI